MISKSTEKKLNDNLLDSAIKPGKFNTVKLLVQNCTNINEPIQSTSTPLHVAAEHGHYKIIKFLIENGAKMDSTLDGSKEKRFTPLHLAVQNNHLKCAELLLKYGASVSPKLEDVFHPIHLAVFDNNVKMVSLLLDYDAKVNLRFSNNFFEVFECKMHRSLWLDHDLTLLHYSILKKLEDMTDLLLSHGADVNLKTSLEKTTLMQAVEVNNLDLVKFLVKIKNANVNDRDIFGQPVLHFTMINANRKVSMYSKKEFYMSIEKCDLVYFLVSNGADPNARFPADEDHSSVIHYMIKCGFSSGVYTLLSHKDFNFNDIDLESILSGQLDSQKITPDIADDFLYLTDLKSHFRMITLHIIKKYIALQILGYPVNEDLILKYSIHKEISLEEHTESINLYRNQVMEEIKYLKEITIDNTNITLWYLLTCEMNELMKLVSKKIVRKRNVFLNCDFCELRAYYSILDNRIIYALERKMLLKKSTEYFSNLFINHLPYDCCENFVNYFKNSELNFN